MLTTTNVHLYDFATGLFTILARIDPGSSTGIFAGATGVLYASGKTIGGLTYVAELNGEIVGSGYARIEEAKHYLQHEQHSYLGFMYVEPQHRGKGINKIIIDALTKWSLSQNITELRLEVYYNNISAITAYEKVGFAKHMIEMRKGL